MKAAIVLSALICFLPHSVLASTWQVEKDGSGDFVEIQHAIDAAAAGDTIRIGPGRFDTFHPFTAPGWTEEVIVGVTKDNLTFIGSGKDVTIVGTSAPYGAPGEDPKCFCSIGSFDARIQDLTIENVEEGIYWWEGNLVVQGCVIRGNSNTYIGMGPVFNSLQVLGCDFELLNQGSLGISTHPPSGNISVHNCHFSGVGTGLISNDTSGVELTSCIFEDLGVGAQFDWGTTGTISDCKFFDNFVLGIQFLNNSIAEINDTYFSRAELGLAIGAGSVVTGTRVVLENSIDTSIILWSQVYVNLTQSHILPSSTGRAIWSTGFPYEHINQDMQGNFWGTDDPDSIAAMIWDSNDDPSLHFTVLFEPFAGGPVPTEKKSFGSVKAMFR